MKILKIGIACLFVGALLFSSVNPAFGWGTVTKHAYHFNMQNQTGADVNDALVWCTAKRGGPWFPPQVIGVWSSTGWPISFPIAPAPFKQVKFGPGTPPVPNLGSRWFNIDFLVTGGFPLHFTHAWFKWTKDNVQVGSWVALGWRIASPPALYNPATRPDGTPNTNNMIVRNIQFAVSPSRIANDSTTLDNPIVIGLFASSCDPIRPGPSSVTPDAVMEIPIDCNFITEPQPGGSTVLVKGTVEDENGVQVPFVVQFIAEPNIPTLNQWGLIVLALLVMSAAVWVLMRRRARLSV
jgi:hypothetical protein